MHTGITTTETIEAWKGALVTMMRSFLVLYTALTLVSGATPVEQEARVDVGGDLLTNTADNPYDILASSNDVHWKALTAWVREQGGFVHDFLEARRDAEGGYGVFTKGDLQADETILVIPSNLTINSYRTDDICKTLENLQFELDRKNESSFAPYVNFLRETVPRNGIPATWSEAGLELLEDMVSGLELPPQHPAGWNELSTCDLEENDLFAAQLVRQVRTRGIREKTARTISSFFHIHSSLCLVFLDTPARL